MTRKDDTIIIGIDGVITETGKAVLFDIEGDEIWIPKSLFEYVEEDEIEVSSWFAEEEGLV